MKMKENLVKGGWLMAACHIGFCVVASSAFAAHLTLKSQAVKNGKPLSLKQVFNGFGCTGENISPDMEWTGAPKDTKFFALTLFDPDAPTGSGFWHWTVYNIPATVTSLALGASGKQIPEGAVEGRTDFGKSGYGGPCPPVGHKPHHYVFRLFALKDKIVAEKDAPAAMIGFQINQLKLAEGKLVGVYRRKE